MSARGTALMLSVVASSLAGPAWAGCEGDQGVQALVEALDDAEESLSMIDIGAFKAASTQARDLLACLSEPIPRHVAAKLHRVQGLLAFGERDPDAVLAFAAARSIEPGYSFPRSLVPRGSPVLESYAAFSLDDIEREALPLPAEGYLDIDGRTSPERPTNVPAVVQRFDASGAVAFSEYLWPGDPVPEYEQAPPGVIAGPVEPVRTPWRDLRVPLAVTTVGTGVAAGTLYGLSLAGKARYTDIQRNPIPDDELPGLRSRTNALAVGSAVAGGMTVVSGVLLATTW